MTGTETPTPPKPAPAKTPPAPKAVEVKPLELKDLTTSKEGVVVVKPRDVAEPKEPVTIVNSRLVLGFGGPLAVEDNKGRGLFKALGGDAIYELSDGSKHVLAKELAEAVGVALPAPSEDEKRALEIMADPMKEAEFKAEDEKKAAAEKEAMGKTAPKPTTPPPTPHPNPPPTNPPTSQSR